MNENVKFLTADGTPYDCKFRHAKVGFDVSTHRVVELDGVTMHSDTCAKRKAHYKATAAARAQAKRDALFADEQAERERRRR